MRALRVLQAQSEAIRARVKSEVAASLGGGASAVDLAGAAARAHAAIDEEGRRALARPGALLPACSAGCSYCCHVHVDATVPEILAIAEHLARTSGPDAIAALEQRLAAQVRRVETLDDDARWGAKIPCALLGDDGRCSIYDVRPIRCRAFHSCSVDPCRDAFAGRDDAEPVPSPRLTRAHDAVEAGYDEALAEAGLSAEVHRLESGLLLAIQDPAAVRARGAGSAW